MPSTCGQLRPDISETRPAKEVDGLASAKLLQGVLNLLERLEGEQKDVTALRSAEEPTGWKDTNERLAPLFLNHDLRIADAHELGGNVGPLQAMGFDTGALNALMMAIAVFLIHLPATATIIMAKLGLGMMLGLGPL